jgi:hypothetical protein
MARPFSATGLYRGSARWIDVLDKQAGYLGAALGIMAAIGSNFSRTLLSNPDLTIPFEGKLRSA